MKYFIVLVVLYLALGLSFDASAHSKGLAFEPMYDNDILSDERQLWSHKSKCVIMSWYGDDKTVLNLGHELMEAAFHAKQAKEGVVSAIKRHEDWLKIHRMREIVPKYNPGFDLTAEQLEKFIASAKTYRHESVDYARGLKDKTGDIWVRLFNACGRSYEITPMHEGWY